MGKGIKMSAPAGTGKVRMTDARQPTSRGSEWSTRDDHALIAQLRVPGTPEHVRQDVWETLVRRWQGRLFAFARNITRRETVAEDIVQETFLDLWRAITRKGVEIESLKGWLFRLVSRKAMKAIKKNRRDAQMATVTSDADQLPADPGQDAGARSEKSEIREALHQLVTTLPDRLRIPILLHFGSGFTQVEVAEMVGCGQSTVSERLNDGLAKLKQGLTRVGYGSVPAALPAVLSETLTATEAPVSAGLQAKVVLLANSTAVSVKSAAVSSGLAAMSPAAKVAAAVVAVVAATTVGTVWMKAKQPPEPTAVNPASFFTWDFDTGKPEDLKIVEPWQAFFDTAVEEKAARKVFEKSPDSIVWSIDGGKSGGGLKIDKFRGIALPIALTDEPILVTFDRGFFRQTAAGLVMWPDKRFPGPISNIHLKKVWSDPPPEDSRDWKGVRWFIWSEGDKRISVFVENGTVLSVTEHQIIDGQIVRPYLAGVNMDVDNISARRATDKEIEEVRLAASEAIAKHKAIPESRKWKAFTDEEVATPGITNGKWNAQVDEKTGCLDVRFKPKKRKPEKARSFCYIGENQSTSFEVKGLLVYKGDRERFQFELGICHPNRINFSGTVWSIDPNTGPWRFHLKVFVTEKGVMKQARLCDIAGRRYYGPGDTPSDVHRHQAPQTQKQITPKPTEYESMQTCGFAVAATDAIQLSHIRIRPLQERPPDSE